VTQRYASWGRYPDGRPARVERLAWSDSIPDLATADQSVLAYGLGRSYGDVCLNAGGVILDTTGLDRIIEFDRIEGVVRAEAGVTLAEILSLVVPAGWFLPVTPGTKWVTLGGAVANDVHGKNHHAAGTFGRHVRRLGLVRSTGERLELTPADDLFRATVAGLGLTGLITWVEFTLQPITSDLIRATNSPFRSLDEFYALSAAAGARSPYVVAWLDSLSPDGRGVLMEGRHAGTGRLPPPEDEPPRARASLPFDAPSWALSRPVVRAFNAVYSRRQTRMGSFTTHYEPFFYPLDVVDSWNRGYGRRGFHQHQSVLPLEAGEAPAALEILRRVARSGAASFLTVAKIFGDIASPGLMSFPREGVTLSLDFPRRGDETTRLLRGLDDIVREAGGRVYPAKDACMTPSSFRAFFPQWETFAGYLDPAFSSSFWRRVTSDV
jgi:FAD/FMN-containing dehydrogenase